MSEKTSFLSRVTSAMTAVAGRSAHERRGRYEPAREERRFFQRAPENMQPSLNNGQRLKVNSPTDEKDKLDLPSAPPTFVLRRPNSEQSLLRPAGKERPKSVLEMARKYSAHCSTQKGELLGNKYGQSGGRTRKELAVPTVLKPSLSDSSLPVTKRPTRSRSASPNAVRTTVLKWCQQKTHGYPGVNIHNFSSCWSDGLAFCALLHHFRPNSFDFSKLSAKNRRHNFELAFRLAEEVAKITPLLEVDDMLEMGDSPDWKCVLTYVLGFYSRFKDEQ